MLMESVHVNIKNIGLFFMEGPHPTVPSVKLADALANFKPKNIFQFEFILKIQKL